MYAILHLVSERTVNRVADNGFFKTSFRGFRKTDVLEYIDTLNAAHCEEVAAMQGQLSALQTEHDALQKAHTALESEAVALREKEKELSFAHDELTTAKNQVAFLTEQTNSQREKLAALQETAGQVNALRTETAVQKQQLAGKAQLFRLIPHNTEHLLGLINADHIIARLGQQNRVKSPCNALFSHLL